MHAQILNISVCPGFVSTRLTSSDPAFASSRKQPAIFLENIHSWHVDSIFHWNEQMKQISIPIPSTFTFLLPFFTSRLVSPKKNESYCLLKTNF